ncbi:MAG TPA: MFS transporter [Polyangiales bacterium]|nr:MFS transporter [Polyangiales bacterium]
MRLSLLSLAFGNFVIGSGALVFIGMLDSVATDLDVSIAAAGQIAGLYSLGICVSGPLLGGWTSRVDRRNLLTISLGLFALGHVWAALVNSYAALLAVRVLTAFAGTLYTPQAAGTAAMLVSPERRARTMAFVFLGWSLSAVVGLPAGAWIGTHFGYRTALWLVAGLAVLGTLIGFVQIPRGLHVAAITSEAWRALVKHPALTRVVSVTMIHASAQFVLFSYLVVAYRDALGAGPDMTAILLGVMGAAGFLGNIVAGALADRLGTEVVIHAAIASMLCAFVVWLGLFALGPSSLSSVLGVVAALLWGFGNFSANSMQQVRLVNLAPGLASVSVALNTSAIYLGQFVGAGVGGLVLTAELTQPASRALPYIGLPVFVFALWVSIKAQRRAA